MSDSLFDSVISAGNDVERPAFRQAPPGEYLVKVRSAKNKTASTGTRGIEIDFTLMEVMHTDGDMDGVDLKRCRLTDRIWVSENSVEIARQRLARIAPDLVGKPFSAAAEELPGAECVVRLKHVTEDRNGETLRIPRLEVAAYYSVDWYMQNKRAA